MKKSPDEVLSLLSELKNNWDMHPCYLLQTVAPEILWSQNSIPIETPYSIRARKIEAELLEILDVGQFEGKKIIGNYLYRGGKKKTELLHKKLKKLYARSNK